MEEVPEYIKNASKTFLSLLNWPATQKSLEGVIKWKSPFSHFLISPHFYAKNRFFQLASFLFSSSKLPIGQRGLTRSQILWAMEVIAFNTNTCKTERRILSSQRLQWLYATFSLTGSEIWERFFSDLLLGYDQLCIYNNNYIYTQLGGYDLTFRCIWFHDSRPMKKAQCDSHTIWSIEITHTR